MQNRGKFHFRCVASAIEQIDCTPLPFPSFVACNFSVTKYSLSHNFRSNDGGGWFEGEQILVLFGMNVLSPFAFSLHRRPSREGLEDNQPSKIGTLKPSHLLQKSNSHFLIYIHFVGDLI